MSSTTTTPSLLLLPQPPTPSTCHALSVAYRSPLLSTLTKLKPPSSLSSRKLTIAIAAPLLQGPSPRNKTIAWDVAQSLLAGIYTLVAVICAQEDIPTAIDAQGGVDVRVVLVDHARGRRYEADWEGQFGVNNTCVLDLAAFASRVMPWETVFCPSTEAGYELQSQFLKYAEGRQKFSQSQLVAVEGGLSMTTPRDEVIKYTKGYGTVCLGGTFDYLHPGHKLLLHTTALLLNIPDKNSGKTCTLIVGISGDELLVNKKYASELQPWNTRAQGVLSFLTTLFNESTNSPLPETTSTPDELTAYLRSGTVTIRLVNIHDPFGPTITEESVEAIVVSAETRSGGHAINVKRAEKGWQDLEVFEIDVLDAREVDEGVTEGAVEDFSMKISSSSIRQQRAEAKKGADERSL